MSTHPYEDPSSAAVFNNNNNNPNDFSYPDEDDEHEDVDNEVRAHLQQQMLEKDPMEAGVQHVNFLLEILSMKAERPVLRLSQLSSSFFVLAFKQLFGDVPEGVNIAPQTIDDRINNARVVIESIESKLDMSLAHISPELVATHDELHIAKLLRVFVDIVTPSEGEMMGLAGDDTRGEDDDEGDEYEGGTRGSSNSQHQLFSNLHQQQQTGSTNAQYAGSASKQSATTAAAAAQQQRLLQQQQQKSQQAVGGANVNNNNQNHTASSANNVTAVRPQPQVMVRDWLTGLYSHGHYEKQPDSMFDNNNNTAGNQNNNNNDGSNNNVNNGNVNPNNNNINNNISAGVGFHPDHQNSNAQLHHEGTTGINFNSAAENTNNKGFSQQTQQQQQQQTTDGSNQQQPLYQQAFIGTTHHDGFYNPNLQNQHQQDSYPNAQNQYQHPHHQNSNNNIAGNENNTNNVNALSSTIAEARRVRRVADFIERSNIPRYQTQLCDRLSNNDGRYVRQFTGDGPLSTIGVASMQKQSTTSNASMAHRPLPAMTNARRDAKIERLRAEKFLQDAQDRAVREVVRQASREEVRMVQELKLQLAEQRQTFLSLDKLAKEKDQRLRQIYNDNIISSVGAAKNKGMKLNLHKNAADLVRRERKVVEREKFECEAEIRLQFEVLRAKRESYLSHLSSWRVAVMNQQQPDDYQPQQQQQQVKASSAALASSRQQHFDPHQNQFGTAVSA